MYDIGLYGGKMENFKTAHVRFEDANIKFMENKISMLWTDTGCSTNCKKTSVVKLDDIEKIRYCVIKDNEYNFIQVKKKSDNEICSLDEAIKSETCFIVKENEEHAVNNMLEYIKIVGPSNRSILNFSIFEYSKKVGFDEPPIFV